MSMIADYINSIYISGYTTTYMFWGLLNTSSLTFPMFLTSPDGGEFYYMRRMSFISNGSDKYIFGCFEKNKITYS